MTSRLLLEISPSTFFKRKITNRLDIVLAIHFKYMYISLGDAHYCLLISN